MTSSDGKQIAALTGRWRRSPGSRSYEPFEVLDEVPISIVFGRARPRQLLFVTKNSLLQRIYDELHQFPKEWVVASRPGIPGEAHARELSALSRRIGLPVGFVGDIAPYDVHVFLEYRRQMAANRAAIRWAGIDDAWLRECDRRLGGLHRVLADLEPVEHKHLDQLERCAPSLPALVGEGAWSILRAGRKLTLEAASGVAAYGHGMHQAIVRSLMRR